MIIAACVALAAAYLLVGFVWLTGSVVLELKRHPNRSWPLGPVLCSTAMFLFAWPVLVLGIWIDDFLNL
jgi:hypothetical protein